MLATDTATGIQLLKEHYSAMIQRQLASHELFWRGTSYWKARENRPTSGDLCPSCHHGTLGWAHDKDALECSLGDCWYEVPATGLMAYISPRTARELTKEALDDALQRMKEYQPVRGLNVVADADVPTGKMYLVNPSYLRYEWVERKESEVEGYWENVLAGVEAAKAASELGDITAEERRETVRSLFPLVRDADARAESRRREEEELRGRLAELEAKAESEK